ncbi:hypothetical protein [Staphylococcus aureus]|uniref:hypothetical protein n=1 Tax=Staphylococcus aureus TaxID=1280 RepID=UPI00190E29E1|nr:hypothetical protein [Staphylococcus aureus]
MVWSFILLYKNGDQQRPPKQLKQSIHRIKQLNDAMIQLAQQLNYFKNIHSIPD